MKYLKGIRVLIGPSTFALNDNAPMVRLAETGCEIIENPFKRKLTKSELIDLLSDNVTGLIAGLEPIDLEVLEKTNLKVISRPGSGTSNIDLKAAERLGVKVYSTPYGPTTAVAELTLGAMICILRMISPMDKAMHEGKWNKMTGVQLEGKTVAIIGFGRIGRKVALLLKPFCVRLIAVDPVSQGDLEGVEILPFHKALKEADIITIHVGSEKQIFDDNEFECIKKGAFLLNVARGGLINEGALIRALESGKIAGAWLDAFSKEPYNGPLNKYPQVILTPHVGSYTRECRRAMEIEAVNNLISAFGEAY